MNTRWHRRGAVCAACRLAAVGVAWFVVFLAVWCYEAYVTAVVRAAQTTSRLFGGHG